MPSNTSCAPGFNFCPGCTNASQHSAPGLTLGSDPESDPGPGSGRKRRHSTAPPPGRRRLGDQLGRKVEVEVADVHGPPVMVEHRAELRIWNLEFGIGIWNWN